MEVSVFIWVASLAAEASESTMAALEWVDLVAIAVENDSHGRDLSSDEAANEEENELGLEPR